MYYGTVSIILDIDQLLWRFCCYCITSIQVTVLYWSWYLLFVLLVNNDSSMLMLIHVVY